jgi:hypothetical protein
MTDVESKDVVLIGARITISHTLELFDLACSLVRHGDDSLE